MNAWRALFAFAAFWNAAIGGMMLTAPALAAARLDIAGAGGPYAVAMTGLLIAVFGVGYAMVAHAPGRHRGIVIIGALSKLGAAALAGLQYAQGLIPTGTFALGMGDLVFVALFALFLVRGPRAG